MSKAQKTTPGSDAPALYTLEQVHEMTGWSLSSLRRAMRVGSLAGHKLGRSIRISRADLEIFLAGTRFVGPDRKKLTKSVNRKAIRKTSP